MNKTKTVVGKRTAKTKTRAVKAWAKAKAHATKGRTKATTRTTRNSATDQMTVRTTPAFKARTKAYAKANGLKMGVLLAESVAAYIAANPTTKTRGNCVDTITSGAV